MPLKFQVPFSTNVRSPKFHLDSWVHSAWAGHPAHVPSPGLDLFRGFFLKVGTVGIFISHKMGVQSMGYEDWYMGYSYPISAKYGFSLEFKTIMKQWVCKTLAKLRVLRYPSSNPRRTSHRPWIQEPQAMVSSRAVCLLFEIGLVHPRVCCWSKWLTVQSTTICSVQNHFQIHIAVHFFPLKSSSSNPNVHFSNPSFCWFNPHFRYLNHLQPVKPPFFILKPTIFHTSTVLNPPFFPWFNRPLNERWLCGRAPARNPASPPSQPSAGPRKWRLRCRCWPRKGRFDDGQAQQLKRHVWFCKMVYYLW